VLHVSKYIRNGMVIGVFPHLFSSEADVQEAELHPPFVDTPKWTGQLLASPTAWKIIGKLPPEDAARQPAAFRIGPTLYEGDVPVGTLEPEQWNQYPELLVWGKTALENHLEKVFGVDIDVSRSDSHGDPDA
jgi:hypothetical protein